MTTLTPATPESHTIMGADARTRAQIETATAAFRAAGLELPALEIHVQETFNDCGGYGGLFNRDGSGTRVDLCSGHQFTVFHEFAHVWEYHHVNDTTRAVFLELHSLDTWRGREAPWGQRGAEMAAETIAKGLQEGDLPLWQCEEAEVLDEGFTLLTGRRSERFAAGKLRCAKRT